MDRDDLAVQQDGRRCVWDAAQVGRDLERSCKHRPHHHVRLLLDERERAAAYARDIGIPMLGAEVLRIIPGEARMARRLVVIVPHQQSVWILDRPRLGHREELFELLNERTALVFSFPLAC